MKMKYVLFAGLAALLAASCKKETLLLPVFRELARPVESEITALWFVDSLHGTATGGTLWAQGFILSTADGGSSWQTDTLLDNKMEYVMFDRKGQGYVCGLNGLALHRPPGARHWQVFRVDWSWHRACFFPDERSGIIVSGEGYRGGQARNFGPEAFWLIDTVQIFPNELHTVWFSDSLTAHAAGYGWMMRSDDAGRRWQRLKVPGDFYRGMYFPSPLTGFVCGGNGTLLKTTDGGRSWHTLREGGIGGRRYKPFRALWFADEQQGWVVGDEGLFWMTHDGGEHWTPVAGVPESVNFTDVFVVDGRGWLSSDDGRIFYFEWR